MYLTASCTMATTSFFKTLLTISPKVIAETRFLDSINAIFSLKKHIATIYKELILFNKSESNISACIRYLLLSTCCLTHSLAISRTTSGRYFARNLSTNILEASRFTLACSENRLYQRLVLHKNVHEKSESAFCRLSFVQLHSIENITSSLQFILGKVLQPSKSPAPAPILWRQTIKQISRNI